MITVELQELFDNVMRELVAIKTDIIIMKYSLEQIESQLEELQKPADNTDPFADRTVHNL